ncbi:trans-aconitate methyltransferase 1 [Coemansia spiralis]|uniref:Trans-aconitate methyltransferase 1 n=2 Tax=Coemansia TaxID=4863 RepID=A0A9W8GCI9_9FUNG|nr:S-adenosyl-L-methionine-dependent methyltransferase [Coemansia spiralis]KAJ1995867.1 trans-aconitate methyltransferase 1 [Coemansia umbellata]KAJ2625829.1 trans-aconitate methyltransferase 1 [Coemansia sp. RSA 1358]KAJ2680951.1 trans-aconitate methyltransferase 1 [Coemansia spiralis]
MSVFASNGFNAGAYLALRPAYNQELVKWLLGYHIGARNRAVDVACGPGTFTLNLAKEFKHVVGIDPSPNMIEAAQLDTGTKGVTNVEYSQGFGENLPIEPDSVDLLTVMQGAHWFDIHRFFNEALRVLRPGGTLAMVGYNYAEITDWPESLGGRNFASKLAFDQNLLRSYWEEGFLLLDKAYAPLLCEAQKVPDFEEIKHVGFPKSRTSGIANMSTLPEPWIDSKTMSFDQFRAYIKTWSSYKAWKDAHPPPIEDILDSYFDKKQQELRSLGQKEEVTVEWPQFAIVARKRMQ